MLSPSTLNRVSQSYRRGYQDGYRGLPKHHLDDPAIIKPFANFDYDEGHQAGVNDAKWNGIYAAKAEGKQ